ncbi:leucine-rich repeat domain-containing protein [Skeletonema marinoi]|uniref:Leucine-rich repeat domain-containing protein n=1 Tax=Skeletonema marinoi TaxID=267567 RepID=A0AAD9D8H3_9STRA|nr:leucine-rich repeat domain-containing protein [Skeletonema marinoi]
MADDGVDDVFVYLGGEQEVPRNVRHVVIDRSVKIIPESAFFERMKLVSVETHEGIELIEAGAFFECSSLRKIKLIGVREVEYEAFYSCDALTEVEFSDKLERIGKNAFDYCNSLQKIKMPSVRFIESGAFSDCEQLTEAEFGGNLERIDTYAFDTCPLLRRIAIPLKDDILPLASYSSLCNQFGFCPNLTIVDLVGVEGINKTISSLFLQSWKDEMNHDMNCINQVLPHTTESAKTDTIRLWIGSLLGKMERYKAEHYRLLKQATTLLELAIWKAKIDEEVMAHSLETKPAKRAKLNDDSIRKEQRVTSGASIVIKNVLPFLKLE